MPDWLSDFLRDWAPAAGLATFVIGLIGGAIAGVSRVVYSLFANGEIVSRSRHQAELDFLREQLRLTLEASDRRIAELRQDVTDLERDRNEWRDRFWKAAEAGQILIQRERDTPPHGVKRPGAGA